MAVSYSADSAGLSSCLEAARVQQELRDHIATLGIETLSDFVNYVTADKYEEELVPVRDGCEKTRGNPVALARLRAAWRAGSAALRQLENRQASGQRLDDLDDPLPEPLVTELKAQWDKNYRLTLEAHLAPADSLVGRLYREFHRNCATVIAVAKVRSLLVSQKPRSERTLKLSDGARLELDHVDDVPVQSVVDYYWGLRVLANACALAGGYKVKSKVTAGTEVMMAPLDVNLDYADMALRRTMVARLPVSSQVAWLEGRDLSTRGKMVSLMRQGWPQGEALARAVQESHLEWSVAPPPGPQTPERGHAGGAKRARQPSPRTPRQQQSSRPPAPRGPLRQRTGTTLPGGIKLCKKWHDSRGCTDPCPDGSKHCCDIILPSGKICGGPHRRAQCTAI